MYRSRGGLFNAGHSSAGTRMTDTRWFFAEGATGTFFDMFLLIANPGVTTADVRATYLLPTGQTLERAYEVAPKSRFSIWVDQVDPVLTDSAVSVVLQSSNGVPIIAERAMWWPGTGDTWHEAHGSAGATETGTAWALADGEVGGPSGYETYVLVANTSTRPGRALVTLMFEDGTTANKTFDLAPTSRMNVAVAVEFPQATGKRFGTLVESIGSEPADIVVERAMYSNASGVTWAAGTNALATKLR